MEDSTSRAAEAHPGPSTLEVMASERENRSAAQPAPALPPAGTLPVRAVQRALVDFPPPHGEVAAWWRALEPAARRTLEIAAPLLVGNLDGIPWPARSRANHIALAAFLSRLDEVVERAERTERSRGAERAERRAHGRGAEAADDGPGGRRPAAEALGARIRVGLDAASRTAYRLARRGPRLRAPWGERLTLARARTLRDRLHELSTGGGFLGLEGGARRFLIGFDPQRNAAVEYLGTSIADTDDGDDEQIPASTRHVGLFIPGNDSSLVDFEGKVHAMSEIVLAHERGTTGLVVWQGTAFPNGPSALDSRRADVVARRLVQFMAAVRLPETTSLTVFGFSFGGSVAGLALARGMRADRVVHVSSAGLGPGIRSLDDLPDAARVPHFACMAPGDTAVGPILGLDARVPGSKRVDGSPLRLGHGGNPLAQPDIVRLETGSGALPGSDAAPSPVIGHAEVVEMWGSPIKRSLAALLAGGTITVASPRTRADRIAERTGAPWSSSLSHPERAVETSTDPPTPRGAPGANPASTPGPASAGPASASRASASR